MASITHAKTNTIADWTQAKVDALIAAGELPVGTTLADIVLPSDWNDEHVISGVVESVVAGTNISVDNTDPANPVVNSLSDRYKTTSATSNTIVSSGNLTFTVDAGLSYIPMQEVLMVHDASNHMHGSIVSYSGTTLVVEIKHKTGSGTYSSWDINLDGTAAGGGTDTLQDVTDRGATTDNQIIEAVGKTLVYTSNKLTSVTGSDGVVKTLSYNGNGTLNQVITTMPDTTVVTKTMVYSGGKLTGVIVT